MKSKFLPILLLVFFINLASALPVCSDINQQDISKIPCQGFTVPLNCSGNITAFNTTDPSINFTISTQIFVDNIYNFTINLTRGSYELVDCENNTATFEIKLLEQGYGVTMFGIMFPSILLTIVSLFVSGRMFSRFREDDEESMEHCKEENDEESFVPKSRLMPIIFMLFSFVPMIFITGFVNNHLEEYLTSANITTFYGSFYILFSIIFYFTFLVSFLVWLSTYIKMRRVMRGLDDIE